MKQRFIFVCLVFLFPIVFSGCADITPIEDGKKVGSIVVLQDWFTSCQLLKTDTAVVLFDACFRDGTLKESLAKHGLKPEDVTHVLMTHGHGDHVGGLKLLTKAKLLALKAEQETLTKHAKENGKITQEIKDGEVLKLGGKSIKVFAMPGHTPGSAAFLVDGVLILGDNALITSNGSLVPAPEDRSADPRQAIQSLINLHQRLKKEGHKIDWMVPAHSGVSKGIQALADFATNQK